MQELFSLLFEKGSVYLYVEECDMFVSAIDTANLLAQRLTLIYDL